MCVCVSVCVCVCGVCMCVHLALTKRGMCVHKTQDHEGIPNKVCTQRSNLEYFHWSFIAALKVNRSTSCQWKETLKVIVHICMLVDIVVR